jgi:hypothetical protein
MYLSCQPAKAMGPRAILSARGRSGLSNWQPVRHSSLRTLGSVPRRRRTGLAGFGLGQILSSGSLSAQQEADLLAAITTNVTPAADVQPAFTLYGQVGGYWNLPWTSTKIFADGQPLSNAAQAAIANLGPDQTMANAGECYSATGGAPATGSAIVNTATGLGVKLGGAIAAAAGIPVVGTIIALGAGLVGLFEALFKTRQQLAQAEQTVFCPAAAAAIDGWYAIQSAVNDGTISVQTGVTGMAQLLADYRASPASGGTARMSSTECTSFCILAVSIYAATLAQALAWSNEGSAAGNPVAEAGETVTSEVATISTETGIPEAAFFVLGLFLLYRLV